MVYLLRKKRFYAALFVFVMLIIAAFLLGFNSTPNTTGVRWDESKVFASRQKRLAFHLNENLPTAPFAADVTGVVFVCDSSGGYLFVHKAWMAQMLGNDFLPEEKISIAFCLPGKASFDQILKLKPKAVVFSAAQTPELGQFASRCRKQGIELVFCTQPVNKRQLPPGVFIAQGQMFKTAMVLMSTGHYKQAAAALKKYCKLSPLSAAGWFYLAKNYQLSEQPDLAKTAYNKAAWLDPSLRLDTLKSNQKMRDMATLYDAQIADLEALFDAASASGCTGSDVVVGYDGVFFPRAGDAVYAVCDAVARACGTVYLHGNKTNELFFSNQTRPQPLLRVMSKTFRDPVINRSDTGIFLLQAFEQQQNLANKNHDRIPEFAEYLTFLQENSAVLSGSAFALFDYLLTVDPEIVDAVITKLEKHSDVQPSKMSRYFYAAGEVFRQNGLLADAAEYFKKSLKAAPRFWPSQFGLGLCFHASGSKQRADRHFADVAKAVNAEFAVER